MKSIFLLTFSSFVFLQAEVLFSGIVKPINQIQLSVLSEGQIEKIYFQEGSVVNKESMILSLEKNMQALETKRKELAYLDKSRIEALKKNIAILQGLVQNKKSLYESSKAISYNALQQNEMELINLEGQLETLYENKKKEKIEFEIAKQALDNYYLKSPINGIIVHIKPKVGEWVQRGDSIVTITDVDKCYLEIDVDFQALQLIKFNQEVKIKFADSSKVGHIDFISPVADNSSGLVRVKIVFDNKDRKVIPGMNAEVIF